MRSSFIIVCLGLAACAGSIEGGEIDGTPLPISSAIFYEQDGDSDIITVVLSNKGGLCGTLKANDHRIANLDALSFTLGDYSFSGLSLDTADIEPGDFKVRDNLLDFEGKIAGVTFFDTDNECDLDKSIRATDGKVTVDAFNKKGSISGTFDVEMAGDDIRGSYNAGYCDISSEDVGARDTDTCD